MNASARFQQDSAYFEQIYEDWLRYGSKVRIWQPWIGIASCVLGAGLLAFAPFIKTTSLILVFFGIAQVVENLFYRRNWVANRLASRRRNESNEVSWEFSDEGITQVGPNSTCVMKWSAIVAVRETPNGINLHIGDGMSVYIPKTAISPADAIPDIVEHARRGA